MFPNKFNTYFLQIFSVTLLMFLIQSPSQAQNLVRPSYDSNPYQKDTSKENNWKWVGPKERTIYNPLDGGILLKYTAEKYGDSDCCSAGAPREQTLFEQACFAHDTNYNAPFPLAGFPGYPNGGSNGQEIADYLFYKDMQLIVANAKANSGAATNFVNNAAADLFYSTVLLSGKFRGEFTGKKVLEQGGVVAVMNGGAYVMTLKVKWTDPKGIPRSEEVSKPVGQTAVIPFSKNSKDIEIECWAVGGKMIFTRKFPEPKMHAYTVGGTTLINSVEAGLKDNVTNIVRSVTKGKETRDERTIKFYNGAGYVADMMVMYSVNQNVGGTKIAMPKVVVTDKITAGISRSVVIPQDIVKTTPIKIFIRGYGTTNNDVFSATVETDFTGERSFEAWGTFIKPQGGKSK